MVGRRCIPIAGCITQCQNDSRVVLVNAGAYAVPCVDSFEFGISIVQEHVCMMVTTIQKRLVNSCPLPEHAVRLFKCFRVFASHLCMYVQCFFSDEQTDMEICRFRKPILPLMPTSTTVHPEYLVQMTIFRSNKNQVETEAVLAHFILFGLHFAESMLVRPLFQLFPA